MRELTLLEMSIVAGGSGCGSRRRRPSCSPTPTQCEPKPTTCSPQPTTCSPQPTTCDPKPNCNNGNGGGSPAP